MSIEIYPELKRLLLRGLEEDGWALDFTSIGSIRSPLGRTNAEIIAKSDGIFVGEALARASEGVARDLGFNLQVKALLRDGERLNRGAAVFEWEGDARIVLALERPFLNLASFMGGIATKTAGIVARVEAAWKLEKAKETAPLIERSPRVVPTRKTLPGYRDLSIASVIAGGGSPHRVSLSGGVLIKENHIESAGGIRQAIEGCRAVSPHGLKVEIEVKNLRELEEAVEANAEVIMLDNLSAEVAREAVTQIRALLEKRPHLRRPVLEVSGGLNEDTIAAYVFPGIDILSLGSLTHSVIATDLSLLIK